MTACTLREHLDAQLDVLQRIFEGDASPETVQEAVKHNHAMMSILRESARVSSTGGVVGPDDPTYRLIFDNAGWRLSPDGRGLDVSRSEGGA